MLFILYGKFRLKGLTTNVSTYFFIGTMYNLMLKFLIVRDHCELVIYDKANCSEIVNLKEEY